MTNLIVYTKPKWSVKVLDHAAVHQLFRLSVNLGFLFKSSKNLNWFIADFYWFNFNSFSGQNSNIGKKN